MSNGKFDLKIVHDNFTSSLILEDDIDLIMYLASFNELNKFFTLLGTVFSFVSKDLKQKMDILHEFVKDVEKANFSTVKNMIEYEKTNQLLHKNGYTSGSRTLLRLHRGLDFIREFLCRIHKINNDDNTSSVCREAYDKTLAQHHPFLIRKGAHLAMYTLPSKEQLLIKVCGDEESIQNAIELLPETLKTMETVFLRIETLYTVHDLHSLP